MNDGPLTPRAGGRPDGEESGGSPGLDDLLCGLDSEDPRSPSKQIATQLRSAILAGHLKPETRLPSQQQLCTRYGVARETVKAALRQLAAEGLISGRQGSRSVVRPRSSYEEGRPSLASASPKEIARFLDVVSHAHEDAMAAIRSTSDLRQAFEYATQLIDRSTELARAANELRTQTAIKLAEDTRQGKYTVRAPESPRGG